MPAIGDCHFEPGRPYLLSQLVLSQSPLQSPQLLLRRFPCTRPKTTNITIRNRIGVRYSPTVTAVLQNP